jgi:hypothetical protein
MSDDIEIRAVLDTSAMLSYARGHVHVGEILVDIAAEEAVYAGLPAVALLAAYARTLGNGAAMARLGILVTLPAVVPLTLGPTQAADAASLVEITNGDLARAHTVWAALEHGAYYLTTEPHRAPAILTDDQVHPIPEADA